MFKIIIILAATVLSGCAAYFDSQDPCQAHNRPAGYQRPTFCGASAGGTTYVTRDFRTNNVIATTRSSR